MMGFPAPFRLLASRLSRFPRVKETLKLHVEPELKLLQTVESVEAALKDPLHAPGVVFRVSASRLIEEEELSARLRGHIGGEAPAWANGSEGAAAYGVCLCRVKDTLYASEFGALITPDGAVLHSSVAEALFFTPDLSALPDVTMVNGAAILSVPSNISILARATVFMAWGGRYNYGHFLLDCLPALCVVAEQGLLGRYPIITPKLSLWQRDLLKLMLGESASDIVEVDQELIRLEDAVFATPMDHFLHAPSAPLGKVRSRILSRLPYLATGPRKLYLSRRKDKKRPMLNEVELEKRLEAAGFSIIHAKDLDITVQISLFSHAEVVVGATGAALANCLFCAPDTKVFEIQPTNYTGIWTRGLCHEIGIDWFGYFAPSPGSKSALLAVENRPGAMFAWSLPIEDFMIFLNKALDNKTQSAKLHGL